ncbi:hypothetical protein [Shewanella khirikhana]|uniref:Pili assembly chaperone N-terminal domain-containing protein n=1 Tax=Shewanella khirikhana TaxID=1965282 RepID=A0ABM7DPE9_9GAMM|nr:hypothetical protein [Shewanella khirikhana]AZQ11546.1 hypothetical protein STH12_02468 [Shewanella khirikhana]
MRLSKCFLSYKYFIGIVCSTLMILTPFKSSAISVTPMELYGQAEEVVLNNITVTNDSKVEEYVSVKFYEILNPGTPLQKETPVSNSQQLNFSVFPSRFRLEPGESEAIRIIMPVDDVNVEKLYRVRFIPGGGFDRDVTVKVSYGVLVRVLPKSYIYKLGFDNNTFRNEGNVRLHVETSCSSHKNPEFRIYPNMEINILEGCDKKDYSFKNDSGKEIFPTE